jgi:signal transduction histidine kinase
MPSDDQQRGSEREQTDESLRVEREKVDQALQQEVAAIDETADAVIDRARARADAVLAEARAKMDRQSTLGAPSLREPSPKAITRERVLEDRVLREERANADETLRDERTEHVALLSRERDETDQDLSRERARSDDALATRDEFLGIVSHDLRVMLNTMVGSAALIADGVLRENHVDAVRVHAGRIQRSAARMSRLIGDLVDLASIQAGVLAVTREVGDPTHVVSEAVETFQAQASAGRVTMVTDIVPSSPPTAFDSARILQVLSNLLSNAIKFTPPNGSVRVRAEQIGDEMRFTVSDTGVGIPADKLEAIFVRFLQVAQNDRRGVGLGLDIARAIVQGHGGRIWAESRIGEGSTFCFTLPIHRASKLES